MTPSTDRIEQIKALVDTIRKCDDALRELDIGTQLVNLLRDQSENAVSAADALEALAERAPAIPEGFVLVPKHPTFDMIEAGHSADPNAYGIGVVPCVVHYRAMLSGAPQPPPTQPLESVWRMGVEATAKWHDEQAAYAVRQIERAYQPIDHPFQMAEKIDPEFWSKAERFHRNCAVAIRALTPPASLAVAEPDWVGKVRDAIGESLLPLEEAGAVLKALSQGGWCDALRERRTKLREALALLPRERST